MWAILEDDFDCPLVNARHAKNLRAKIPALREALDGRFDAHHALLIGAILSHLGFLNGQIERRSEAIEEQHARPTAAAGSRRSPQTPLPCARHPALRPTGQASPVGYTHKNRACSPCGSGEKPAGTIAQRRCICKRPLLHAALRAAVSARSSARRRPSALSLRCAVGATRVCSNERLAGGTSAFRGAARTYTCRGRQNGGAASG